MMKNENFERLLNALAVAEDVIDSPRIMELLIEVAHGRTIIKTHEARIANLNSKIREALSERNNANHAADELRTELDGLKKRCGQLQAEYNSLLPIVDQMRIERDRLIEDHHSKDSFLNRVPK